LLHLVTLSGLGFKIDVVGFMPKLVVYATLHPARVNFEFRGVRTGVGTG
jgi:hypothetical protein